ncbi:hypothetical protein [Sorangium sp. So ce362]|uniref:hypothetical protein n=1 Tax=Sorangium sp. So ce362 TaxID=3133303 RepID=UPI003F5E4337
MPAWARTSHKDEEHADDPIVTVTFADGLGRVIQTKKDQSATRVRAPRSEWR